jgi:hypothetical protein
MDQLEQEIKNRLAQSTSLEGVDSEALWNSISSKVYRAEIPSKKRRFRFIWFFWALIAIGSIGLLMIGSGDSYPTFSPRIATNTEQFISPNSRLIKEDSSVTVFIQNTPAGTTISTQSEEENVTRYNRKKDVRYSSHVLGEEGSTIKNRKGLPVKSSNSSAYANQLELSIPEEQTLLIADKKNEETPYLAEFSEEAEQTNRKLWQDLLADSEQVKRLSTHSVSPLLMESNANESPISQKSVQPISKKTISWKIYGGVALFQNNYKDGNSNLADSLNQNLSMYPGFSVGGLVQIKRGKNWNVHIGMEYAEWNDQLDKIFLSDTLIDSGSNQVFVQNTRTVKHFNTASIMTVPLQLGIFKDLQRFRLGMDLGISYSFVVAQSGRLLKDNNTIVNYSQNEKRFQDFLSAPFAPTVGFKLQNNWMISAFCNFGFQGHGSNAVNQLKNSSVAITPSLGLTFNY